MRSVTSCFDLTLYKKDMARFWPLWVLYTVFWLFMLPLSLISNCTGTYGYTAEEVARWAGRNPVTLVAGGEGLILAVGYGALVALAVWSYLYNSRSANMMHALPVRREGHFITHYLAGVTMFVLPHVIVFFATLGAEAMCGAVNVGALAASLGCQTLMCLFFFSFATACGMLTGHVLVLPAFYGIFNFLVVGLSALLDWLGTFFFYGYTGGLTDSAAVKWLTPAAAMVDDFGYTYPTVETVLQDGSVAVDRNTNLPPSFEGVSTLVVYAVVALLLAVIALLLYRKRHMETAGDVVAVLPLRPVFLYCVAFCAGLAGGCFTCEIFAIRSLPFLIFGLLVWGVIGYFAALMLLNKSFRVFRNGWKGCLASMAVLLVLCGVMQLDPFGVERRVPAVENVAQLRVYGVDNSPADSANYLNAREITDPEAIAKAIAVHQTIVDEKNEREAAQRAMYLGGYELTDEQIALNEQGLGHWEDLTVVYLLKDGTELERDYNDLWLDHTNLKDPTSLESRLTELINDRTILAGRYHMDVLENGTLIGAEINDAGIRTRSGFYVNEGELVFSEPYFYDETEMSLEEAEKYGYDYYYSGDDWAAASQTVVVANKEVRGELFEVQITEAQAEALRQAVLNDFYAGRLGVRYLFNKAPERQENTCVADLTLHYEYDVVDAERNYTTVSEFTITLTPQAEETIAALAAMNAFTTGGAELRTNSGELIVP